MARRDDIPLLAEHFLSVYAQKNAKPVPTLTKEALDRMVAYEWPGNVRQLENVIERAVVLSRDSQIDVDGLPDAIALAEPAGALVGFDVGTPLAEIERRVIHATLRHTDGDKQLAAQLLGISARTIYRKLDAERGDEPLVAETPA
jgi:two-component system response regulator HydG